MNLRHGLNTTHLCYVIIKTETIAPEQPATGAVISIGDCDIHVNDCDIDHCGRLSKAERNLDDTATLISLLLLLLLLGVHFASVNLGIL